MDSFFKEPVDLLNFDHKLGLPKQHRGPDMQLCKHMACDSSYSEASTAPPSPLPETSRWIADVTSSTPSFTTVQDAFQSSCPSEVDDIEQPVSRSTSVTSSFRRGSFDSTSSTHKSVPSERLLQARAQFTEVISKIKQLERDKNRIDDLNDYNTAVCQLQAHTQESQKLCVQELAKHNQDLVEEIRSLKSDVEHRKHREDQLLAANSRLDARVQDLERTVKKMSTLREAQGEEPCLQTLEKEVFAFRTDILEREVELLKQSNYCLKTENTNLARRIQELQDRLDRHERIVR